MMGSSIRVAALSTVLALVTIPAIAGEADRARQAIAEAQGKIDAAVKSGAAATAGLPLAQARDALVSARARLDRGRKEEAITDAQHASELADRAIVTGQDRRVDAERGRAASAEVSARAAQQSAADAESRAADANSRAAVAADRADAAQASAASANAEADALRNAPPPPAATTVDTTETRSVAPAKPRRVTVRPATPATVIDKTTVTTTTTPQ